ncbi:hypothetical protein [Brucella intermedia]|uniref:hypothetical protein n=1 Tax=Brucella intermedia TaxID=94625 RepID=UPI00124C854D|nr:hypothetical protein [Brucella intermedia]KAB2733461.1 hypothetical protein F9L02_00325 [Brucella intermedia]
MPQFKLFHRASQKYLATGPALVNNTGPLIGTDLFSAGIWTMSLASGGILETYITTTVDDITVDIEKSTDDPVIINGISSTQTNVRNQIYALNPVLFNTFVLNGAGYLRTDDSQSLTIAFYNNRWQAYLVPETVEWDFLPV